MTLQVTQPRPQLTAVPGVMSHPQELSWELALGTPPWQCPSLCAELWGAATQGQPGCPSLGKSHLSFPGSTPALGCPGTAWGLTGACAQVQGASAVHKRSEWENPTQLEPA